MVKGLDVEESKSQRPNPDETPPNSPMPSNRSDSDVSQIQLDEPSVSPQGSPTTTAKGRAGETMDAMVRRIQDFMKACFPFFVDFLF